MATRTDRLKGEIVVIQARNTSDHETMNLLVKGTGRGATMFIQTGHAEPMHTIFWVSIIHAGLLSRTALTREAAKRQINVTFGTKSSPFNCKRKVMLKAC